jgi:hypothetical protein
VREACRSSIRCAPQHHAPLWDVPSHATAPFPANRNPILGAVSCFLLPVCCLGAPSVAVTIHRQMLDSLLLNAVTQPSRPLSRQWLRRHGAPIVHASHHTNNLFHSSKRTCVPPFGNGLTRPAPPLVLIGPASPSLSLLPSILANSTMPSWCRSPFLRLILTSPYTSTTATSPPLLVLQYQRLHQPPT